MKTTTDRGLCPRCATSWLPAEHPGALSRADNATEVCSWCGIDEAGMALAGRPLPLPADWPIDIWSHEPPSYKEPV